MKDDGNKYIAFATKYRDVVNPMNMDVDANNLPSISKKVSLPFLLNGKWMHPLL
jgi:hypothetical protein